MNTPTPKDDAMATNPEQIAAAALEELGEELTHTPIAQLRQLHAEAVAQLAATPAITDPTGPAGAAYERAMDHACIAGIAVARIDAARQNEGTS